MEQALSLTDKLNLLWDDVLMHVKIGIDQGIYPKVISKNFKRLTKRDVLSGNENSYRLPECEGCVAPCCSQISGKIVLSLLDVARLVDAGHSSAISGSFRGFAKLLELYLETADASVFGEMGVLVSDQLNQDYMPSLKKIGSQCVFLSGEGRCTIYAVRPEACRRFPLSYDYETKKMISDQACINLSEKPENNEWMDATRIALHSENERMRDIALLMLDPLRVAAIGFADYL